MAAIQECRPIVFSGFEQSLPNKNTGQVIPRLAANVIEAEGSLDKPGTGSAMAICEGCPAIGLGRAENKLGMYTAKNVAAGEATTMLLRNCMIELMPSTDVLEASQALPARELTSTR